MIFILSLIFNKSRFNLPFLPVVLIPLSFNIKNQKDTYLVYILKCDNLTYVGMTNNFFRRWQQHNGILSGGAKYTKKGTEWFPICIIDGFETMSEAMQCEWKLKSKRSKISRKLKGAKGCIEYLNL